MRPAVDGQVLARACHYFQCGGLTRVAHTHTHLCLQPAAPPLACMMGPASWTGPTPTAAPASPATLADVVKTVSARYRSDTARPGCNQANVVCLE